MPGPKFDFTVNLGQMISIGAILVTMVAGWVNFDARLGAVEKTVENSSNTLLEQVRQGADLRALTARVDRLERLAELVGRR